MALAFPLLDIIIIIIIIINIQNNENNQVFNLIENCIDIYVPYNHHNGLKHIVIKPFWFHKMKFVRDFAFLLVLVALATAERIPPGWSSYL